MSKICISCFFSNLCVTPTPATMVRHDREQYQEKESCISSILFYRILMYSTVFQIKFVLCPMHTGTDRDCQRPGRARATTARTDCLITLAHLCQRFLPATVIPRHYGLSAQTIRNRLQKINSPIHRVTPIKAR